MQHFNILTFIFLFSIIKAVNSVDLTKKNESTNPLGSVIFCIGAGLSTWHFMCRKPARSKTPKTANKNRKKKKKKKAKPGGIGKTGGGPETSTSSSATVTAKPEPSPDAGPPSNPPEKIIKTAKEPVSKPKFDKAMRDRHKKYMIDKKKADKEAENLSKFKKMGKIHIPAEATNETFLQNCSAPNNVILTKVFFDETLNEQYDIGTDVDDIELDESTNGSTMTPTSNKSTTTVSEGKRKKTTKTPKVLKTPKTAVSCSPHSIII